MYGLYDTNGYKGFMSTATRTQFIKLADKLRLPVLQDFLNTGFSIGLEELADDIESIQYSFTDFEDSVKDLLEVLSESNEIIIISNEVE